MSWALKRTRQCGKCPWRQDVDPYDIPNGYSVDKHKGLASTIATPGDLSCLTSDQPQLIMACHETADAHCVGWLMNQLGPGNNIGLRLGMRDCANAKELRTVGPQHERFEDTLPEDAR